MRKSRFSLWMAGLLLALPALASAQQAITNGAVNLRAGPDVDYPRVRWLPEGTPVDVQGCLPDYRWCDVIVYGDRGWIFARFLSYPYRSGYEPLITYGPVIGLPIIEFSIWSYWDDHYTRRPWYSDRPRWENRRPYPPGVYERPPGYRLPPYPDRQYRQPEYRPPAPRPPEYRPPAPRQPEFRPPAPRPQEFRPPTPRQPEVRQPQFRGPDPRPPQAAPPQFRPPEARPPQQIRQPQQPSVQPQVTRPSPPAGGSPPPGRPPGVRSNAPPGS